ncbi:hypothetical protein BQ8482_90251 [Mesorhizobium delmotii]|uniref:Uncharacterized protein n=1 Tax=Mesorhizobium delmotii TaxID=1631247 RepID=A0A2P9AXD5_9HYPH|nr:hypothetical protein BQ8482_90251 [Mesorhizobium delmotii]
MSSRGNWRGKCRAGRWSAGRYRPRQPGTIAAISALLLGEKVTGETIPFALAVMAIAARRVS